VPAPSTSYDTVIGLHVTDQERYRRYRSAMTPLLAEAGGRFRYDFTIDEVLKAESGKPINRLFVISFPDQAAREAFLADPRYQAVRTEHFVPAVDAVTTVATYRAPGS
jgi:uncharacterized protein (DUF1330 family)